MRARLAGVLLVVAAAARAADPAPAPSDSISGAKKEFSEIHPVVAPDAGTGMPTLDLKDLGPAPGSAPAPTPTPQVPDRSMDPSRKRVGDTWLLDAMEGKGDTGRSTRPGEDLLRADATLLPENDRTLAAAKNPSGESREKEPAKEPQHPAFNPLDGFMAGWISARDHDLLLPHSKGETLGDGGLESIRVEAAPESSTSAAVQVPELALPALDSSGWLEAKVNPYLAAIETPEGSASRFLAPTEPQAEPLLVPESVHSGEGPAVDPRSPDGTRQFLPDFAQPGDDEKYFRQLKKF